MVAAKPPQCGNLRVTSKKRSPRWPGDRPAPPGSGYANHAPTAVAGPSGTAARVVEEMDVSDFVTSGGSNPLQQLIHRVSARARSRRAALFRSFFPLTATTTLLDVGSWDCESIHRVVSGTALQPKNVHVADIRPEPLFSGARKYGYTPVLIEESGRIPFPDQYCDIVHCS